MVTEIENKGLLSSFKSLFKSEKNNAYIAPENELYVDEYVRPSAVGIEVSTSEPMSTRTVMFEPKKSEKATPALDDLPTENLDILFAEKFIESGGKFMFCETLADTIDQIKLLAETNEWAHVFTWENEIKDMFCEYNFQKGAIGYTIERSSATACLCESLIAENGTLVLNSKQSSRRRLPGFPKTQIFIAQSNQIGYSLSQALVKFSADYKDEIPSILSLQSNTKGNFYHDNQLVFKADGPDDVYLILVDEAIPKSTRV